MSLLVTRGAFIYCKQTSLSCRFATYRSFRVVPPPTSFLAVDDAFDPCVSGTTTYILRRRHDTALQAKSLLYSQSTAFQAQQHTASHSKTYRRNTAKQPKHCVSGKTPYCVAATMLRIINQKGTISQLRHGSVLQICKIVPLFAVLVPELLSIFTNLGCYELNLVYDRLYTLYLNWEPTWFRRNRNRNRQL